MSPATEARVAAELLALELALARRDPAALPGGYGTALHQDFVEIGASGRRWSRAETLELLATAPPNPAFEVLGFEAATLADDVVLVTYDTAGPSGRIHRSSTWVRADGRWQMRFHQATREP